MRYLTQKAEARYRFRYFRVFNVLKTVPRCKLRDLPKFATLLLITDVTHLYLSW